VQFVVIGWDGPDAAPRRDAARPAHLAKMAELREAGTLLLGAVLTEGDGIAGSLLVLDVESRAEVDAYLEAEPLNTEGAWERVTVQSCRVGDAYLERLRADRD
jgi:uncharacterized protein YciI